MANCYKQNIFCKIDFSANSLHVQEKEGIVEEFGVKFNSGSDVYFEALNRIFEAVYIIHVNLFLIQNKLFKQSRCERFFALPSPNNFQSIF